MTVRRYRLKVSATGSDRPRARWYDLDSGTMVERDLDRAGIGQLIDATEQVAAASSVGDYTRAGAELYRWLDGPTERWLQAARNHQHPIELRLDVEERLRGLPWELLHDEQFLATHPARPVMVVREAITRDDKLGDPLNRPLRLLFMASSPLDVEPVLAFEGEEGVILDATRGRVDVVVEESGSLAGLGTMLSSFDEQFDVLHLNGHGWLSPNGPRFVMEDDEGRRCDASAAEIAEAVSGNWPRLVFVSACQTAGAPDAGAAASMAEALVDAGAPAVLGWALPVGDKAASDLAAVLYRELGAGAGLLESVTAARRALQTNKSKYWPLLQLYADQSPLGPLVTPVRTKGRQRLRDRATHTLFLDADGQVAVADRRSFVGRRRDLQQLLRELRPEDPTEGPQLALIHGMGGLGKSTLTARLLDRMRPTHPRRAVWVGQLDVDNVIKPLTGKITFSDRDTEKQINEILGDGSMSLTSRLTYVLHGPLATESCVFVFDNFEDGNLDDDGRGGYQCTADALAVLTAFCTAISRSGSPSRVIVTSRHSFPLPREIRTVLHGIAPLTGSDLEKKLRLTKHLGPTSTLDTAVRERAVAVSAGLPRLLETMDDTLATIASDRVDAMLARVEEVTVEYREELILDQILAAQPSAIRRALALASIYEIAVPLKAMLALDDEPELQRHLQAAIDVGLIHAGLHPSTNEMRYLVSPILLPLLEQQPEKLDDAEFVETQRRGAKVLYRLWVNDGE